MFILYDIAMRLMSLVMRIAGLFSPKAKLWSDGRRKIIDRIKKEVTQGEEIAWFHAASLGEFEQGRPVIEAFRKKYPSYKIFLTFFSPSGYEIRKNYAGADYIFYLPVDTARNAYRFVSIVKPKTAVFIKYEIWANYLRFLSMSGCRTFLISAIFRPDSAFFKWYGGAYRRLLAYFEHIFVQNGQSEYLLGEAGFNNVSISGDTRFDRVWEIAAAAKKLPLVESFKSGSKVLVAGSTWKPDEDLLASLINESTDTKFIIAPHEIEDARIEKLRASIQRSSTRYTAHKEGDDISQFDVLFVDTIGILSSVYSYGEYAYIGGGFGVGIHNTLEAAAFGLPLAFGPNYHKFKEAADLISHGGASSVSSVEELSEWFTGLNGDKDLYEKASRSCADYVAEGRGATEVIMSML